MPDPSWIYAVAAVYQMILATGTVSTSPPGIPPPDGPPAGYSEARLAESRDLRPAIGRRHFAQVGRQYELPGVSLRDRSRMDENLWAYVDTRLGRGDAVHLREQWGEGGAGVRRDVGGNVEHTERCRICRTAYQAVTRGTALTCNSRRIGLREKKPKVKRERKRNQGSTVPPT